MNVRVVSNEIHDHREHNANTARYGHDYLDQAGQQNMSGVVSDKQARAHKRQPQHSQAGADPYSLPDGLLLLPLLLPVHHSSRFFEVCGIFQNDSQYQYIGSWHRVRQSSLVGDSNFNR